MVLCVASCLAMTGCGEKTDYTVGICQLMEHDSLDKATQGFIDALTAALKAEGKPAFSLDSKEPTGDYQAFINGEARYTRLAQQFPERAEALFEKAEQTAKAKYERLKKFVDFYS